MRAYADTSFLVKLLTQEPTRSSRGNEAPTSQIPHCAFGMPV